MPVHGRPQHHAGREARQEHDPGLRTGARELFRIALEQRLLAVLFLPCLMLAGLVLVLVPDMRPCVAVTTGVIAPLADDTVHAGRNLKRRVLLVSQLRGARLDNQEHAPLAIAPQGNLAGRSNGVGVTGRLAMGENMLQSARPALRRHLSSMP